jgi:hypothetical protein
LTTTPVDGSVRPRLSLSLIVPELASLHQWTPKQ